MSNNNNNIFAIVQSTVSGFPPYYFPLGLKEAKSKNILSFCSYLQKNKTQQDKLSKVEIMAECNSSTALFTEQRPKESVERRKQYSSKNVSIKNAIYFILPF